MFDELSKIVSEKLRTDEKLWENEENSRVGGLQKRKKPTSLSVVFIGATTGTVQRLRLLLLRLFSGLLWDDTMESPHALHMSP